MRVVNRIVVILLLAGLFVLGVYMVVYAFRLFGYSLGSLPISDVTGGLQGFLGRLAQGSLSAIAIAVLVLVALAGLILLILELRPSRPRYVRMDGGTYVTRGAVEEEISTAAEQVQNVLGSSVRVQARRSPGANVDLEARVRRGADTGAIQGSLREAVQGHLSSRGLPVNRLNVKLVEVDPRQARTRVQ